MYFAPEVTEKIDAILMRSEHAIVGAKSFERGRLLPALGTHYYASEKGWPILRSLFKIGTLGLRKVYDKDKKTTSYHAWYGPFSKAVFADFLTQVQTPPPNMVQINSIDTSDITPTVLQVTETSSAPKPNQVAPVDTIVDQYQKTSSVKTLVSGARSSGKSYLDRLVKSELERRIPGVEVELYNDFNPTAPAVNIRRIALQHATPEKPVVLVINEIDVVYQATITPLPSYDPRTAHAQNKQTFNALLDAFDHTPNLIVILTTEKPIDELWANEDFRSYMRKGRVDFFVEMTPSDSRIVPNEYTIDDERKAAQNHPLRQPRDVDERAMDIE